jgi:hypothetical protein
VQPKNANACDEDNLVEEDAENECCDRSGCDKRRTDTAGNQHD